jgi:methylated-DNA-[protein]-cysteine S-methyltransferase
MSESSFALFDTPVGRCAVIWNALGLCGLLLPESDEPATRARLRRRFPDAQERPPSPAVAAAVEAISAQLDGRTGDLRKVALDYRGVGDFERRVYEAARAIPPGETVTYGAIARELGQPDAARAVGQALGRNPFPLVVPCHRVVAAGGRSGGFSAPGGVSSKLRLLALEGAPGSEQLSLF